MSAEPESEGERSIRRHGRWMVRDERRLERLIELRGKFGPSGGLVNLDEPILLPNGEAADRVYFYAAHAGSPRQQQGGCFFFLKRAPSSPLCGYQIAFLIDRNGTLSVVDEFYRENYDRGLWVNKNHVTSSDTEQLTAIAQRIDPLLDQIADLQNSIAELPSGHPLTQLRAMRMVHSGPSGSRGSTPRLRD